jgi:hypothetical protein
MSALITSINTLTSQQWRWLLLEGVVPLFGAGLLYWLYGLARMATSINSTRFAWSEAFDAIGWLYGAFIISIQMEVRAIAGSLDSPLLQLLTAMATLACMVLLLAAMAERGQDSHYRAPLKLKLFSFGLVLTILSVGTLMQNFTAMRRCL